MEEKQDVSGRRESSEFFMGYLYRGKVYTKRPETFGTNFKSTWPTPITSASPEYFGHEGPFFFRIRNSAGGRIKPHLEFKRIR